MSGANHRTEREMRDAAAAVLAGIEGRELTAKERLALPFQEMPCREPNERARTVDEVSTGYSVEQARVEAARCLQCRNAPCVAGCPVAIDIPGFIAQVAKGDFQAAAAVLKRANLFPAICGRVCPQETQCQMPCTVGKARKDIDQAVAIGRLERFVADWEASQGPAKAPEVAPTTGKRVAVVGTGPAGLACAADLLREGHAVTMFEAFHKPGGVMIYGIPEFRLPKSIVAREVETLLAMGAKLETNTLVGRTVTLPDLLEREGFDAAFLGVGAGLPKFMGIPGENLVGVFSANEYLTRANLMKAYDAARAATPIYPSKVVAVLGGGNVAMDAARMALRLGASEVHVVYRRTRAEMPARKEEIAHAEEEGIVFDFLRNPTRALDDGSGRARGLELQKYELGAPDESGRRSPVPIAGSEYEFPCDTVIVALGNEANPLLSRTTPGLAVDRKGRIVVDGWLATSVPHAYAGGDIVLGAATVILAMGQGRQAAASIHAHLTGGAGSTPA